MCEPTTLAVGLISLAASAGMAAKQSHDTRKAQREAQKQEELADARQRAVIEAKGAEQQTRTDTAAADEERKRRMAVAANNNVLTSRQGVLAQANTASTALGSRTTMG